MTVLDHFNKNKIVAIIRLDDLSNAVDLTQALIAGGINTLEFTLTNPDATRAMSEVRDAVGDKALIGAGSVINVEQVKQVANAGAQFVVSPVTKADVIEACHQHNLPTMPGAYTPTEIQMAWEMDVAAVKIFPAGGLGAKYIKDVLAPLPHLRLMPTGGVKVSNIAEFLEMGAFAVGVGGALCDRQVIARKDWDKVANTARQFCEAIS